ncbi:MAG TPA: gephyrin-like molybdotransferase Glp [Gemmataceae bacterium]|nr:gephyrin-like molybdotransferase Glp [Gemmataceae bacterium]
MLAVSAAQTVVLGHARSLPAESAALSPALLGAVLAEEVTSDLDVPPYDKSMMDGYAVRSADLVGGRGELTVVEEVLAGQTPRLSVGAGQATRIMTGAPLPAGADAVVMVERTQARDDRVHIDDPSVQPGRNIVTRGREMRCGEVVLRAGAVVRPQEIGLLATVGRARASVIPSPRVAVLSTGDEVVEPAETPGPGQIRNSNGPMLLAQAARAGGRMHYLGIARDRLDSLRPLVEMGLQADVLLLSGGVSAGKLDLTPGVLQDAGVVARFHKVEMKPGKPVLFGTRDRSGGAPPTLVFGLPGNPVSSFVCFELFVGPAIRRLRGLPDSDPTASAVLVEDFTFRTDRPTYHPARLEISGDAWRVRAVPWFGSADLRGLLDMDALVVFPPGDHRHAAGTRLTVVRLEDGRL